MVPHCGSKTINVRLTVSPDSKSKTGDPEGKVTKKTRLKSRRLFKYDDDDDEDEGSGNGCLEQNHEVEKTHSTKFSNDTLQIQTTTLNSAQYQTSNGINNERYQLESNQSIPKDVLDGKLAPCSANDGAKVQRQVKTNQTTENIYETAPASVVSNENIVLTGKPLYDKVTLNNNNTCCQDCRISAPKYTEGMHNSRPCVRRLGRKSRSQKAKMEDYYPAARTRSLSVGNENSFRNSNGDASSGASGKDRNDECLNNLRRNDLIGMF